MKSIDKTEKEARKLCLKTFKQRYPDTAYYLERPEVAFVEDLAKKDAQAKFELFSLGFMICYNELVRK